MAGSKSDVYEVDVLKAATGQTTTILVTTPITPYLALFTVAPTDSTAGTEVSGGSYARVSSAGKWAAPASGSPSSVSNNATITFPTATGSWGTVVSVGIFDALSGGNRTYYADLTASKTIGSGDIANFTSGQITLTED